MERFKSIALTFLVVLSLVQSFFLTYSMPNFDGEKRAAGDYVVTEPMGPEEKIENLIYPEKIILHMGNNEHTLLPPGTTFYNIILDKLQGRSYDGFQMKPSTSIDWSSIQANSEGIELKYNSAIPVKLLQKAMPIADDPAFQQESVSKMMIYTSEEDNDVIVLFLTADGERVYESTRADLTVQDIKQQVEFGRELTPYQLVNGAFYIPKEPLEMVEVKLPYTSYAPEQMVKSLFFDPALTKIIRESDGSTIYTDGKRGLQLQSKQYWMTYTDATAPTDGPNDLSADVWEAVNFVNKHGGWNGRYRLAEIPIDKDTVSASGFKTFSDTERTLKFQLYWGSYPIISTKDFKFGYLQVKLQQGMVMNYERSLLQLGTRAEEKEIHKLPGGEVLIEALRATNRMNSIMAVEPVYEPILMEKQIHLRPVWQITFYDGSTQLLRL
ncbi:YycH family regulatory protein [Paenibacillus marinisediminis]